MRFVLLFFMLAVCGYYVSLFVPAFLKAKGSFTERAVTAGEGSMTLFVAKATSFIAAAFGAVMSYLAAADVAYLKNAVAAYLQPEYVSAGIVVLMFVVQLARNRTR